MDFPTKGQTFSKFFFIKGWAFSPGCNIISAVILINGKYFRDIQVNEKRPDVKHMFEEFDVDEKCGFLEKIYCEEIQLANNKITICVEIKNNAGNKLLLGQPKITTRVNLNSSENDNSSKEVLGPVSDAADDSLLLVQKYNDLIEYEKSGKEFVEFLEKHVAIKKTDTVLEIGCGAGRTGKALSPLCKKWIGVDSSSNMVKLAANALGLLDNIELIHTNGYNLSEVKDETIDVVYCTIIFMLLDEWDRFNYIVEAYRVLKPGGRIYIDNMNLLGNRGWETFQDIAKVNPANRPSNMCKASTPQEFQTYLEKAGFKQIKIILGPLFVHGIGVKQQKTLLPDEIK